MSRREFEVRSTVESGSVLLSSLLAVLVTLVICATLVTVIPNVRFAYLLFPLYSEMVGIDAYGAILPLLLTAMFTILVVRSRKVFPGGSPFRMSFLLFVGALTMVGVGVFQLVQTSTGSFTLSPIGGVIFVIAGGYTGLLYPAGTRSDIPAMDRFAVLYIVGFSGMLLSDLIRTFAGLAQAPGEAIVWGGSGTRDLVLWFGFYMALSSIVYGLLIPHIRGLLSRLDSKDRHIVLTSNSEGVDGRLQ